MKFIHIATLLATAGCVNSPLLNHADAEGRVQGSQIENVDCPFNFPKAGLCASLVWEKKQTDSEKGSFIIRFWEEKTGNVSGPYLEPHDTVFVELIMVSMGHGTYPLPITEPVLDSGGKTVPGVYRTKNVYFMMPGEWKIFVQLKHGSVVLEAPSVSYIQ